MIYAKQDRSSLLHYNDPGLVKNVKTYFTILDRPRHIWVTLLLLIIESQTRFVFILLYKHTFIRS